MATIVLVVPRVFLQLLVIVTKRILRGCPGATSVFPFRFGGEPIAVPLRCEAPAAFTIQTVIAGCVVCSLSQLQKAQASFHATYDTGWSLLAAYPGVRPVLLFLFVRNLFTHHLFIYSFGLEFGRLHELAKLADRDPRRADEKRLGNHHAMLWTFTLLDAIDRVSIELMFFGGFHCRFYLLVGRTHQEFSGRDQDHLRANIVRRFHGRAKMLSPCFLKLFGGGGIEGGFGDGRGDSLRLYLPRARKWTNLESPSLQLLVPRTTRKP